MTETPRGHRISMNETTRTYDNEEYIDECAQSLSIPSIVMPVVVSGLAIAVFVAIIIVMLVTH